MSWLGSPLERIDGPVRRATGNQASRPLVCPPISGRSLSRHRCRRRSDGAGRVTNTNGPLRPMHRPAHMDVTAAGPRQHTVRAGRPSSLVSTTRPSIRPRYRGDRRGTRLLRCEHEARVFPPIRGSKPLRRIQPRCRPPRTADGIGRSGALGISGPEIHTTTSRLSAVRRTVGSPGDVNPNGRMNPSVCPVGSGSSLSDPTAKSPRRRVATARIAGSSTRHPGGNTMAAQRRQLANLRQRPR